MKYVPEHEVGLEAEASHLGVDLEQYTFVQCARLKSIHILPTPEGQNGLGIYALCGKDGQMREAGGNHLDWGVLYLFCEGFTYSICNKCLKAAKQKEVKPKDGFAPYVQTDGTARQAS